MQDNGLRVGLGQLLKVSAMELWQRIRSAPNHAIATHHDETGNQLNTQIAAIELINILRPIVAVARFVAF